MSTRSLVTHPLILTPLMILALVVAWISALMLRFGHPFRDLFPYTCIYLPDEQVRTLLVVSLFALGSAIACFVTLCRHNVWLMRFMFRFLVAMIAFGFGVCITMR